MPRIDINGIEIDYELIGDAGAPATAITPGGRFTKESVGVPELARAIADGGRRVLMWDRPSCGSSDICFKGQSESVVNADTLLGLIRALDLGPTALCAGSAGSRVSLIAASRGPDIVTHLCVWWVSGGPISLAQLAAYYYGASATAAAIGGMEAVVELPDWQEQLSLNPRNRDILLSYEPGAFIATLQEWAKAFAYSETSPVPGMSPETFAAIKIPVLIFRNGESDMSHTRRTSDWVAELIPHAEYVDAPWGDQEWNHRSIERNAGRGHLFEGWPKLAPQLLEFMAR